MRKTPRAYSPSTEEALLLLGRQIRLGRKRERMSERELAERIGVARSTVRSIEKGAPTVAIGLVLEAAVITGARWLAFQDLARERRHTDELLALMPAAARKTRRGIDDDF